MRKLMKYELRCTARIMLPVYALTLVLGGMCALFYALSNRYESDFVDVFNGILIFVFITSVIAALVLSGVIMVYRFYKNLMTDEGYLTFTLPVSTHAILLSKLLTAVIWSVATALCALASVFLATFQVEDIWADFPQAWRELLWITELSSARAVLFALELAVLLLLSSVASYLLFYAAISLGHSFSNHKILLSVVFYFAFTTGLRTLTSVFALIGGVNLLPEEAIFWDVDALLNGMLMISIGFSAIEIAGFYILTYFMLKKRLNLQ